MGEIKRKIKISVVGVILAAVAVMFELLALAILGFGTGSFMFIVLFALAGFVSHFACRKLCCPSFIGLSVLCVVLLILYPFTFGTGSWWFGAGVLGLYFAAFFAFIMLLGWAVGVIPSMIAKTKRDLANKERALDIAKLTVLLLIVAAVLCAILNLFLGNPITAYIAGEEMRDWLKEREETKDYEILDGFFPSYSWYNTEYTFDLAGDGSRWVLHWKDGRIRLDSEGW